MFYCEKKIKAVTQLDSSLSIEVHATQDTRHLVTPAVSISELRKLDAFVQYYSERTRDYTQQIEHLRERSHQLLTEATQLLQPASLMEKGSR